jgi:hypothetical protein
VSLTRFMLNRLRRKYFTDLHRLAEYATIPLGIDAELPALSSETVDGRVLEFAAVPYRPRLRVAVAASSTEAQVAASVEAGPVVLGAVLGLDYDEPKLHICNPVWHDWAAQPATTQAIEQCARVVWQAAQRNCEG